MEHVVGIALEFGVGQHAMHQPHGECLVGVVAPAEEHDLARARMADGLHQALMALDVVGEAELRRRDAELRRGAAVAQIAGERDLDATAQAEAVNHCQARLGRALDGVQHAVEEVVVLGHRAALGAPFFKFRDIRAGGERLGTRAAKGDAAHFVVGVEALHRIRDAAPHGVVDGVLLRRLVEHDPADGAAPFDQQRHGLPAGP